jgi:N-dimethylarginine dimethylaminohydrolase
LVSKELFQTGQLNGIQPPPPLTPRDWQISLGQKLLRMVPVPELRVICNLYKEQVVNPHGDGYDPDCILNGASASCIVRVGRDIFFDNSEWLKPEQSRWIIDNVLSSEYRIHEAKTDGHGDAVFAILKPGVILSSKHDVDLHFDRDFPGWEVLRIMDSSIDAAIKVGQFKQENFNGRWYVPGQTPTAEFTAYVDTYLKDWVGFVEETVFDVNCLVLDESNVIFSAYNRSVFEFCEQHKINPIICPLRHSYFWDGGISCCTQDLERTGGLETYL